MCYKLCLTLLVILNLQINAITENIAFIGKDKSNIHTNIALDVEILSTINNKISPRAILKNNRTGELRTYSIGDEFVYDNKNTFKVFHISECFVSVVNGEVTLKIECAESEDNNLIIRSGLSAFRIADYNNLFNKSGNFKQRIENIIDVIGRKYNVDQYLIKSVIKAESNFNPDAVSPKNAQGMMQLIPSTAENYGVNDPFNAHQNIEGGVRFLRDLIEFFKGDLELVLAAYNAGPGTVMKYNYEVPPYPETQQYVKRVKRFYNEYREKG
jgi:hypothetical protein